MTNHPKQTIQDSDELSEGTPLSTDGSTPRKRVLAAIDHHEPDCVPCDLGSNPSSGISAIAYGKLKRL